LDEIPSDQGRRQLLHKLEKFIPCDYQVDSHKAAIRPAIQDRRPVIGKHPEFNSVWIFNGLGTKGALYSPLYGSQLAAAILDNIAIDADVDVARFN
jgi:glycine/D-amino acid oxidase-like deaminating enzyme